MRTPPVDPPLVHRDAMVVELHADVPIDVIDRRRRRETQVLLRRHLPRWRAGGVKAAGLTVGGDQPSHQQLDPGDPFRAAMLQIAEVRQDIRESEGAIVLATSPAAIRAAVAEGRFAVFFNLEGAAPLRGSLGALDLFGELGVRAVQLTWNLRNEAGDGVAEDTGARLTRFGRALVAHANRSGILLDGSHMSAGSFWDLAEHTARPFVCSHSNAAALQPHRRNLDDRQIEAVARSAGLVGVACYPAFLTDGEATLDHVLDDHVEHLLRVAGPASSRWPRRSSSWRRGPSAPASSAWRACTCCATWRRRSSSWQRCSSRRRSSWPPGSPSSASARSRPSPNGAPCSRRRASTRPSPRSPKPSPAPPRPRSWRGPRGTASRW